MECPVCLDSYNLTEHRPKNLPCGHSVCLECLLCPAFGKQCPLDRERFQDEPAELSDNLTVISIIAQGVAPKKRPAPWCRDCGDDFADQCADAGHAAYSRKQLRNEKAASVARTLAKGEAASAVVIKCLEAVNQDALRQIKNGSAQRAVLQKARVNLEAAVETQTGLKPALDAAELLLPRAEQQDESAALAGLRGMCSVVVQSEDGTEWRASVALEDGRRHALRLALLKLRHEGLLNKGTGAKPAAGSTGSERHFDFGSISASLCEMTTQQMSDYLRRDNLKKVRSMSAVDCSVSSKFCQLLLQAVAPQLEELELRDPLPRHIATLVAMPFLYKLEVISSTRAAIPKVTSLPVSLREVRVSRAKLPHMLALKGLSSLRKLDVECIGRWRDAPDLPLLLEELSVSWASPQHLRSIQRMPKLRRLDLEIGRGSCPKGFSFLSPAPSADHCGLSWLRLASRAESQAVQFSLVQAHAATLEEVRILCSTREVNPGKLDKLRCDVYLHDGLLDCVAGCDFKALRRLVLLRRGAAWRTVHPFHSAGSCRRQLRQLRDVVLRRDAAGEVVAPAVLCSLCHGAAIARE